MSSRKIRERERERERERRKRRKRRRRRRKDDEEPKTKRIKGKRENAHLSIQLLVEAVGDIAVDTACESVHQHQRSVHRSVPVNIKRTRHGQNNQREEQRHKLHAVAKNSTE
jgi:hypothetical protein